jgi:16S rRNA pseudouridine516 synthase
MVKMRLDKYLAKCGQGTRTEVKKLIRAGQVKVDGLVCKDPGFILDAETARVFLGEQHLRYQEYHYLMLNKPAGVISATRDRLHPTVLDLLPPEYLHLDLFPVGRLDKDTEGLLLLSDDGILAHRLLAPKRHVPKRYRARVRGCVDEGDVQRFAAGLDLGDFTTLPAQLDILTAGDESLVEVTIYEGKYHQVKRMFLAVGKEVLHLQRVAMGGLALDPNLPPGQVRELTPAELDLLEEWR